MSLPRLQHPVAIVISQIRLGVAEQDPDYRELVQSLKSSPERAPDITCVGQVKWNSSSTLVVTRIGDQTDVDGYVLFRYADLRAAGITQLNINDIFKSMGSGANQQSAYIFIVKLEPCVHIPLYGGATMVKAWFKDRDPSRR
jgi:hypothetical protein